ncbi:MAG: phosphoribosylaminoimidazolesuccinocarboxamide synthase, partial [Candidatus Puniceispirillaceae bacterium]
LTFGWATAEEFDVMVAETRRINSLLTDIFAAIDVRLIDFKLEFGRPADGSGGVMLADEISPDNCRLWQVGTDEKMDKDRFRRDLGGLTEAYEEIARRLGVTIPQAT